MFSQKISLAVPHTQTTLLKDKETVTEQAHWSKFWNGNKPNDIRKFNMVIETQMVVVLIASYTD